MDHAVRADPVVLGGMVRTIARPAVSGGTARTIARAAERAAGGDTRPPGRRADPRRPARPRR
ncbi:hypothetical protein SHL15_7700 [Streptomyces hygroscopicus subsp. limoneus]|nr:hypothetical protein SHL15_7700 [Streptomyces hygroscopicus subsp. limoneus]